MRNPRILIVDDEKQIRRVLALALTSQGYDVDEVASGHEGLSRASLVQPDLILLDLGLPDLGGLEVLCRLREWTQAPIIILSVRETESEKIRALDAGADDYVTKPFTMGELLARVRVALRHDTKAVEESVLTFGELTINLASHLITIRGEKLKLTATEYALLKHLALHKGLLVTHDQLLRAVKGPTFYHDGAHYLRVYIAQLRRKIEEDPHQPRYLITEPRVGYRLGSTS